MQFDFFERRLRHLNLSKSIIRVVLVEPDQNVLYFSNNYCILVIYLRPRFVCMWCPES